MPVTTDEPKAETKPKAAPPQEAPPARVYPDFYMSHWRRHSLLLRPAKLRKANQEENPYQLEEAIMPPIRARISNCVINVKAESARLDLEIPAFCSLVEKTQAFRGKGKFHHPMVWNPDEKRFAPGPDGKMMELPPQRSVSADWGSKPPRRPDGAAQGEQEFTYDPIGPAMNNMAARMGLPVTPYNGGQAGGSQTGFRQAAKVNGRP